MDLYIDEKDKELGRARLSQVGEGASAGGGRGGGGGRGAAGGGPGSLYNWMGHFTTRWVTLQLGFSKCISDLGHFTTM